jgi:hypothetical protein
MTWLSPARMSDRKKPSYPAFNSHPRKVKYPKMGIVPTAQANYFYQKKPNMKKTQFKTICFFVTLAAAIGCSEEEDVIAVNKTSIAPTTTLGRPNQKGGCTEITSREVTIEVWDSGTIDGDVISLIANGTTILNEFTLQGPSNKKVIKYSFANNGFNYLLLYAHNEGSIPPNTAALSINGTPVTLSANLTTNQYRDIVVAGFGVECP